MKLTVDVGKSLFAAALAIMLFLGVTAVFAYNATGSGGAPATFGHSVDEIDWSNAIPAIYNYLQVYAGSGDKISIGGDAVGNDLEIRVTAPATHNNVSFWNNTTGGKPAIFAGDFNALRDVNAPRFCLNGDCRNVWPVGAGGTGTVTSIGAGFGLTSSTTNPITISGNLAVDPNVIQRRVSGTCGTGNAIRVVNSDGTVTCEPMPAAGTTLPTCADGEVLQWDADTSAWVCGQELPDCADDQIIRFDSTAGIWECSDDTTNPASSNEAVFTDEFISGINSGDWEGSGIVKTDGEAGHPGVVYLNNYIISASTISASDSFDVSWILKSNSSSSYGNGFGNTQGTSIGLVMDSTRDSQGSTYQITVPKIIFETGPDYSFTGNWYAVVYNGTNETVINTGVGTGGAGQWFKFRISKYDSSNVNFYINDKLVATAPTTYLPASPLHLIAYKHTNNGNLFVDRIAVRVSNLNTRFNTTCALLVDTGVSARPGRFALSTPAACLTLAGCTIKQELYSSGGTLPLYTRYYSYNQDTTNHWWSNYQTTRSYINGDSSVASIIPNIHDGTIALLDDYSGVETSSTQWTVKDSTGSYGQKLYTCS